MKAQASNIVEIAQSLVSSGSKKELALQARALGWRGDDARAPILQLALFVATKLAMTDRGELSKGDRKADEETKDSLPDWMNDKQGEQEAKEAPQEAQEAQKGEQEAKEAPQEAQEAPQGDGEGQGKQEAKEAPQEAQEAPQEAQEEPSQAQGEPEAQEEPSQAQGEPEAQEEPSMPAPQSFEELPSWKQAVDPEPEPVPPAADEFGSLIAASGIKTPHPMLEKLWRLTVKAGQNVMLIGAPGTGKTMLAAQLAELIKLPFGSISCTMGMSESQLSGWLLPVGENGRFEYVPAPFVECVQTPSVFLFDEADAADANVFMLLQSILANGFMSVPHKLGSPTVLRHPGSIIVAGANTSGNGADDMHTARTALDAATLDRFYPLAIDTDKVYVRSLFKLSGKTRQKNPRWQAGPELTQDVADSLYSWFEQLSDAVRVKRISRTVGTRFAQKIMACAKAGIPVEEIKTDLRLTWTADELARVGC